MDKKLLIGILAVVVLVLVFGFFWEESQEAIITTDKAVYGAGELPVITVKNNLDGNICLSSCYPYYLEKKNSDWQSYSYGECPEPDLIKRCVEPKEAMGMELKIQALEPGLHRVALPACLNCQVGAEFTENKKFYSNEFTIK